MKNALRCIPLKSSESLETPFWLLFIDKPKKIQVEGSKQAKARLRVSNGVTDLCEPALFNKEDIREASKGALRNKGLLCSSNRGSASARGKLKVPPRPFPLEEHSHYKHSGQLQVFFTQLEPNSHGVRQSSHASVETNSNKRISVLGTNHTKIYRVNLVGFKHSAEDPSRSPHHQNKYTLRPKRFSNVLSNHQGRFPETVPEAKHSQTEVPITSD